jgi:hypothetical protein
MPRNGSGVMSIPNTFVDQTTITAGAHNSNWSDAASEISNSVALDGQSQMSGQLKIISGTVAAPGLVPGSDPDTGVYRIGGDNLGVACAGAKVPMQSSRREQRQLSPIWRLAPAPRQS